MQPTPPYHPPKGEGCETTVENVLPPWGGPDGGYCSRRPSPSTTWGSRLVGARELGRWVGDPEPHGNTHSGGDQTPDMTYLPTLSSPRVATPCLHHLVCHPPLVQEATAPQGHSIKAYPMQQVVNKAPTC